MVVRGFWCGLALESLPSLSYDFYGSAMVWVSGDSWVLVWIGIGGFGFLSYGVYGDAMVWVRDG